MRQEWSQGKSKPSNAWRPTYSVRLYPPTFPISQETLNYKQIACTIEVMIQLLPKSCSSEYYTSIRHMGLWDTSHHFLNSIKQ